MWLKLTLVILLLTVVFAVLGLYAGGALFLQLTEGSYSGATWHTLIDAGEFSFTDKRLVYLPWSWCAMGGITFLPIGLSLLAYFMRLKPVSSLHGNARFANDKELDLFEYKGPYQ